MRVGQKPGVISSGLRRRMDETPSTDPAPSRSSFVIVSDIVVPFDRKASSANAGSEPRPMAGARHERTLLSVGSSALFGPALELPRFRGHPIVGAERSIHDAEEPSAVRARVPAADR